MNKKILFSFLLGVGVCSFSVQAQLVEPYLVQEPEDQEQLHEQDLSISTLPLLAQCIIDQDNNVKKILKIKHLGPDAIRQLIDLLEQEDEQNDPMSLQGALTKVLNGTKDVLEGVYIVAIIGGKYIVPRVIHFTQEAWASFNQKYREYMDDLEVLRQEVCDSDDDEE